jgi:hypothetical protein
VLTVLVSCAKPNVQLSETGPVLNLLSGKTCKGPCEMFLICIRHCPGTSCNMEARCKTSLHPSDVHTMSHTCRSVLLGLETSLKSIKHRCVISVFQAQNSVNSLPHGYILPSNEAKQDRTELQCINKPIAINR